MKTSLLQVRITEIEKKYLESIAKLKGITVSELVREAILGKKIEYREKIRGVK